MIAPKLYRKYITVDSKGVPILYMKMNKALYGMLCSALLFYLKLVKDLEDCGFDINPYDPCVANAMKDGKHMTVTWHVDDLKVSHNDQFQITLFAGYLAKPYKEKLTVKRGKLYDYLGMDLDYSTPGKLRISMIKYLDKVLGDFSKELGGGWRVLLQVTTFSRYKAKKTQRTAHCQKSRM